MYEDPNIRERHVTVVFTYASDDENDPAMRGELTDRINQFAEDFGCEVEIHDGALIEIASEVAY
jgi:hypothetical protein